MRQFEKTVVIDARDAFSKNKAGKGVYSYNMIKAMIEDQTCFFILFADNSTVNNIRFNGTNFSVKSLGRNGFFWHIKAFLKLLKMYEKDRKIVFVSFCSYLVPSFLSLFKRFRNAPNYFFSVHDLVVFKYPNGHSFKARLVERFALKIATAGASGVFAISKNTANDLMDHCNITKQKITITNCAVSGIFFRFSSAFEKKVTLKKFGIGKKFLLCTGTLIRRKNVPLAINAFKLLKNKSDYQLVIVGGKGWGGESERIDSMIKGDQDIIRLGFVDDKELRVLYSSARALVFPSLYEGFGIPPLEAFACGCPVVASNASCIPEVIGGAGLLFDPFSVEACVNAIEKIESDNVLRESFIAKGLKRARQFSWQTGAKIALEAIKSH